MSYPIEAMPAGRSDKYGQVYVERVGGTGFADRTEPIALLRGQDYHALEVMRFYRRLLGEDSNVAGEQLASVDRQIAAFVSWRGEHPNKVRTPGTPGEA